MLATHGLSLRFLIGVFWLAGVLTVIAQTPPTRPNIVLLLADDQRFDTLGCTGNPIIQTPNIDRLAKDGVVFNRSYVVSSACAPNRAAILSGMYGRSTGVRDFSADFPPDVKDNLYPFVLQRAGYYIGFIGKWGVAATIESTIAPYAKRFDFWRGVVGQGQYYARENKGVHLDQMMAAQAEEFFDAAPKDKPFCLSVSFKGPHGPWKEFDRRLRGLYADSDIPYPPTLNDESVAKLPPFLRTYRLSLNGQSVDDLRSIHQEFVREYYRLITGVDEAVGKIVSALRRRGMEDNTIIVYTSDNGHFLHEWGFHGKWLMYEPSIRVPLIVYDPRLAGNQENRVVEALTLSIDLAPTFLDWGRAPVPEAMQGRSLVPWANGQAPQGWRDEMFYDYTFEMYPGDIPKSIGVRTQRYKLIRYTSPRPQVEFLFDLLDDPLELVNRIDDPSLAAVRRDLRERLSHYRQTLPDRAPDYEEYVNSYDVVGIGADFPDMELDFRHFASIGQTFKAAGKHLLGVEWRWPFFVDKIPDYGFIVELRNDGPEGTLLASTTVPAEQVYNLNLVHARLDATGLKPGEILYVEIRPEQHPSKERETGLFLYAGNPFPDGSARFEGKTMSPSMSGFRKAASNQVYKPKDGNTGDLPLSFIYRK